MSINSWYVLDGEKLSEKVATNMHLPPSPPE